MRVFVVGTVNEWLFSAIKMRRVDQIFAAGNLNKWVLSTSFNVPVLGVICTVGYIGIARRLCVDIRLRRSLHVVQLLL